jgi:hypothetical protein
MGKGRQDKLDPVFWKSGIRVSVNVRCRDERSRSVVAHSFGTLFPLKLLRISDAINCRFKVQRKQKAVAA